MAWLSLCVALLLAPAATSAAGNSAGEQQDDEWTSVTTTTRDKRNLFKQDSLAQREEGPPRWGRRMTDRLLFAEPSGANVEFKCPAEGNPHPSIDWLKNGKPFNSKDREYGEISKHRWTLKLDTVVDDDQGNYTCVISNKYGQLRWTFFLDVVSRGPMAPPLITHAPRNTTITRGENATLECRIMSDAQPHVQWIKHYRVNDSYFRENGDPYFHVVKSSGVYEPRPEYLYLHNVTNETAGWYTCVAGNIYGKAHKSAWVTVVPPTEEPVSFHMHNKPQQSPLKNKVVIGLMCGLFLVVVAVVVVAIWGCQRRGRKPQQVIMMQQNSLYSRVSDEARIAVPFDPRWEFPRDQLKLEEQVGEGAFGRVMRATATGIGNKNDPLTVAVKMLKEDATEREHNDLVQELKIMRTIGHNVNIINLLGCCTRDGALYIIADFACHGNMRDFLRMRRLPNSVSGYEKPVIHWQTAEKPLTYKNLISFAYQIARGMEYLSSKKIVHRDLAARNVLVAEDLILKIADFGLTRNITEQDYYRKTTDGRLPVKWMAPEALFDRKYSTKSDVWSFGVVMWEVFTLGGNPYPTVPVQNLFQLLREGHRMERPPYASIEIYSLMLNCWQFSPHKRCVFSELVTKLDKFLSMAADQEYLCLDTSECYPVDLQQREEDDDDEDSLARTPRPSDSQYSSLSSRGSCLSSGPPGYAPGHPEHVFQRAYSSSGLLSAPGLEPDPCALPSSRDASRDASFAPDHHTVQMFPGASTSSGLHRHSGLGEEQQEPFFHRPEMSARYGALSRSRTQVAADGTLESVEELTSTV